MIDISTKIFKDTKPLTADLYKSLLNTIKRVGKKKTILKNRL